MRWGSESMHREVSLKPKSDGPPCPSARLKREELVQGATSYLFLVDQVQCCGGKTGEGVRMQFWLFLNLQSQGSHFCLLGSQLFTNLLPLWWIFAKSVSHLSCPTLCDPMDCGPPGSSVHGVLQARILERIAIPFSRGSSWSRDWNLFSCIAGRFFLPSEPPGKPQRWGQKCIKKKIISSWSVFPLQRKGDPGEGNRSFECQQPGVQSQIYSLW